MRRRLHRLLWLLVPLVGLIACESPTGASSELRFVDVAAGHRHTCALAENGDTYCWGTNRRGELGTGGADSSLVPLRVPVANDLLAIEAAGSMSCGLDEANGVHCWGSELAPFAAPTPELRESDAPIQVLALSPGGLFGLDETGRLHGAGSEIVSIPLPEDLAFRDVATAVYQTGLGGSQPIDTYLRFCGVTESGAVYCAEQVERNSSGRLTGTTASIDWAASLERVQSDVRFRELSMANEENCALSTDDGLYCWSRSAGALPAQVLPEYRFESVSVGSWQTCAIAEGGEAFCWSHQDPAGRQPVPGGLRFRKITAGISAVQFEWVVAAHVCGITLEGELYCWGDNYGGQLGDGSTADRPLPTRVTVRR